MQWALKENDASSSRRHSTACLNQELYFVWQPRRTPRTIAACHNVERGSSGLLSSDRSQVDYKRGDKVLCWFRSMSFPNNFQCFMPWFMSTLQFKWDRIVQTYDVFLVPMCLFFRSIKDSTFWKIKVYLFISKISFFIFIFFKCSNSVCEEFCSHKSYFI